MNYSTSSVPFNNLNGKDWMAKEMSIDPAYDITMHTAAGEGEQQEEEGTTDVGLLYQRFQDKVEKKLIQGNRKADPKAA